MNTNPYQFKKFFDTSNCLAGQQVANFMNENVEKRIGIIIHNLSYTTETAYGNYINVAHLLYSTFDLPPISKK